MNARTKTIAMVVVAVVLIVGAFVVIRHRRALSSLPDSDLSAMETGVADALEEARADVVRDPRSAEAWGALGATYHAHRLVEEAAACYERARTLDPEEFRWAYLLAIAREVAGADADELIERFDAAAQLRPDYAPLFLRQAAVISLRGRVDDARASYERAIELDPGSSVAHRSVGEILLGAGDIDHAMNHLEEAIKLAPDDGAGYSALARAYQQTGEEELAARAAKRAATLDPRNAISDPLFEEQVVSRSRSSTRVLARAVTAIRGQNYEVALEALEMVVEARPEDPEVHYWLGVASRETGRPEQALAHLERALELDDSRRDARLGLATVLESAGRPGEAIPHYVRLVELDPEDPEPYLRLGVLMLRTGDLDRALEHLEQAARLRPDDPDVHWMLGRSFQLRGDTASAIQQFERAVEIDPAHPAAQALAELKTESR
jgi:tetratricopeptide (TPR) repeat protein